MKIKINTVKEMVDARINLLNEQIRTIKVDERLQNKDMHIYARKHTIAELLDLKDDLQEIERRV